MGYDTRTLTAAMIHEVEEIPGKKLVRIGRKPTGVPVTSEVWRNYKITVCQFARYVMPRPSAICMPMEQH